MDNRYKQLGGIAVAAVILAVIFVPFQADAFVAQLTLPNADPTDVPKSAGGSKFLVTIDIAPGELIPMSQIEVILDNETPDVKHAVFDFSGKRISGDPNLTRGNLKIEVPSSTAYGYGYGYGMVSYGTSFAPPYSYSFTASPDFLSGNEYGYSYAVANANQVNGFLGPATITIEGKLNTALMDPGTHTLDVLVHTGSGGNGIDKIVPPQLEFTISPGPEIPDAESLLIIKSADPDGNPLEGIWALVRSTEDDGILTLGFTPLAFAGEQGVSYRVSIADYDGMEFQSWEDGSTERERIVELTSDTTVVTATHDLTDSLKGFAPLTYQAGEDIHHSLTVNVEALDDGSDLNIFTIIDPESSDESSTTYRVYVHNYLDSIFRHWEDASQSSVRTITIEEDTTITAFYKVDEFAGDIAETFAAPMHGSQEVPPVSSSLSGEAIFILNEDETELRYSLIVSSFEEVTQAHIHLGAPGENGPVVAFLFDASEDTAMDGTLMQGTLTSSDLVGPLVGGDLADLIAEMESGNTYANVHTPDNPAGEIRGQILTISKAG
jgi:hypothetical protein